MAEKAVKHGDFTLASGKKSDFYIDCKQVTLTAEGAQLVGDLMADVINREAPSAVAVGGLTIGADPIATATSIASWNTGHDRSAFIVRKEPKDHGLKGLVVSASLPPGSPVVIVADVVTPGASTRRASDGAEAAGLKVLLAIAIVDRLEGGGEAVCARVPLLSLFTRDEFTK